MKQIFTINVSLSVVQHQTIFSPRLFVVYQTDKLSLSQQLKPIPEAARSKASVCGRSFAGIVGSNPAGGMVFSCQFRVLSGRGLCDGLITRPDESYPVWCLSVIAKHR